MAAENLPGADQARRAKWTVSGRAPLQIPADPWKSDTVEKLRAEVVSEAAKKDIDLTSNPRALLASMIACCTAMAQGGRAGLHADTLVLAEPAAQRALCAHGAGGDQRVEVRVALQPPRHP